MRSQVHPDDLSKLDAAFAELEHAGGSCKAEYRLAPHTVRQHAGRIRWVTMEGTVLHRPDGRPEQLLGVTRDITERKLAEEALRTSEERLRRVSDNADVGLIRCSRDWFYLSANPAYAKIVSKPLDQIMGRPMAEVMGAEAVETIRPYVERVLRGEHVIYEAEVPFAGAGKRYLHVSYTPDTDAAGQIVGWVACVTDITERKHAENALRLREVELGEAQRLAHIGSWYWGLETDVIVASDELLRIFGLDPATDRVPTLSDQRGRWYPDADWKRVKAAVQRTMRTGVRSELDLQAFRNGTPIWVTARGEVVRNSRGHIIGLRGTIQDITDRKQSELTLAERNTQLELAGRAARVGSYVYDVKEGTTQISQGYAAIHGLPEGTAVTTISSWRARVHPEDLERAEGLREQAFARRRKEDNAEYRIILSTGEDRWIERRGSISYDVDGCPERVVGVNIDISERKKAEAALRESEARLAGQREALELALNGAPLETSLGVLVRAATDQLGEGVRAAFYLANPAGNALHHIVGMPAAYAEAVDGFEIGPESLACGLATHTGLPVLTADVAKEPRWASWLWLAETFDYRGCWSFPIRTVAGRFIGTLAIYWRRPREATSRELELAAVLTATAAIIIARHTDAELRDRAQDALRESEARLNAVIEGAADGILTIDETGIVRSLNTAAVKMFGYAAEEVIGRNVSMLALQPYRGERDGHLKGCREAWEAGIIGARREVEGRHKDGQKFPMDLAVTQVPSSGQRLFVGIVRDISGRKRAEERQRTLVAELDHRVKNALATVSSVVSHTRQGSRSVPDFAAALEGRLRSMAATHELLSARWWQGVSLTELVRRELAPYAARDNTQLSGPEVMLRAEAGQAIAMVLHELVTNAAKYGALSTKRGCVSIRWHRRLNGRPPRLVLEWQEIGGPPVIAPGDPSYGTSTIRDLIPYEFGGVVDLVFAPEGVQCRLELPADWFIDAGDLGSEAIASAATK
jgi:PAS domain S-box-containing protein